MVARQRKDLTLDPVIWAQAGDLARLEHLTGSRVLEVLLAGYAGGEIVLASTSVEEEGLKRIPVTLDAATITDAEKRRREGGAVPSLSALARRLLAGYVAGSVTLTIAAGGTA